MTKFPVENDKAERVQKAFERARGEKGVFGLDKPEDDSWLDKMYAETPESNAFIKSLNDKKDEGDGIPKPVGHKFVEFKDAKGNKIMVPSEAYVKELENKIARQNQVSRTQDQQIEFLNRKFIEVSKELANLKTVLGWFNDA